MPYSITLWHGQRDSDCPVVSLAVLVLVWGAHFIKNPTFLYSKVTSIPKHLPQGTNMAAYTFRPLILAPVIPL
jgi:hypothetical protein